MVLSFLKKRDYWKEVGEEERYLATVKLLGLDYREFDDEGNGYTKLNSIWGRLAALTNISNKNTFEARKWLYTAWHDNRRKIRTLFLSTQVNDLLPQNIKQSSNNDDIENQSNIETVSL